MVITGTYLATTLCVFTGLLLGGLLLFSPYYRSRSNRLLGNVIWVISLLGATVVLEGSQVENKWFIIFDDIMWEYLLGPFFLLYFASLVQHPLADSKKRYWLYAPFLMTLVINIVLDVDMELGLIDISVAQDTPGVQLYYLLEYTGSVLYTVVICGVARIMIGKSKTQLIPKLTNPMWWWFATATLAWNFSWWLDSLTSVNLTVWLFFTLLLSFVWIGYRGVIRLELAASKDELRVLLDDRYGKTKPSLTNASSLVSQNRHLMALTRLMEEERLYRDPKLSRDMVAILLGISSGHLSAQLSINSKSAFYAAFKKSTGQTPLEFKKYNSSGNRLELLTCSPELSGLHN